MRPRLLDLFCKAGGSAMGYHRAGFDVVGVDIEPQPNYPFEFHQADALAFPLEGFDAIHASPPCQRFSSMRRGRWQEREHPDYVAPIRERCRAAGVPFVIENVVGAPLFNPFTLCGTMFGLGVVGAGQLRRHRLFEAPAFCGVKGLACQHNDGRPIVNGDRRRPASVGVWGNAGGYSKRDNLHQYTTAERAEAMGIDWMTGAELSEAIPPAYTEHLGRQLLTALALPLAA